MYCKQKCKDVGKEQVMEVNYSSAQQGKRLFYPEYKACLIMI